MICVPASAHEETAADVAAEIVEHSAELITLCDAIHDETEMIADDDSLDQDLRDLAESIHLFSHELEGVAEHINEHAVELQTLVAAGSGDSPEVAEAIAEIKEHCEEFNTMIESKHEDIHDLVFNAPESHEEYADATHDAAHEAGDVCDHILEHTTELESLISGTASTAATTQTTCVESVDVTTEVAEVAEHSDELFTAAESILLDTKAIVKDETVDQDIRDLAKTIHLVSHELEDIAADLQADAVELQTLSADTVTNKCAIEELIAKMQTASAEYLTKLDSQHENVHELTYVAPESREENADAVHDTAHAAENIVEHLNEHLEAVSAALDAPATPATTSAPTNAAPGFGIIAAFCAVFGAMAYIAVRK